ncbi:hypothetical protein [Klebsiella pneumoniae]|uniref:hypothetical protein n=1 Tax=Klebsiella pneumoniae TaxID=573 RepID=UPI00191E72E0|nr:hypothetical protein [Klebsiella pneumoniae]MBL0818912.1 hypothetical protein [Klebsiella pneumoniae]
MNTDASMKRLQIRVPPAMREPLKEHCKQIDKSPNEIILSLLKRYLEHTGAFDNE